MVDKNLYPFTGKYLELSAKVRMHYLDEGSGEPVLMVHGNPSWSFYYRNLAREVARSGRRAIAPDHIGCGMSDKPGESRYDYTLDSRVRDLGTLIDKLGIGKNLTLVLHDWGGMIGMAWAARHPEAVKRLVLLNTAAFSLPEGKKFPPALRLARLPLVGALLVRGLNLFVRGTAATGCCRHPLTRELAAAYAAPYSSWRKRLAVHRFVQDIPLSPDDRAWATVKRTSDSLGRFQSTPTLIMWGGRDFVFDASFFEEWKRRLPNAEARFLQDAGHYVLEDAAEEVIPSVLEFLNRT